MLYNFVVNDPGIVQKVKNITQLSNLRQMLPFERFFEVNGTVCETVKSKSKDDSKYCELVERNFYKYKVTETLIKETKLWNYFLVNTILVAIGLLTNFICLVVFIHSKYLIPKMGNFADYCSFT